MTCLHLIPKSTCQTFCVAKHKTVNEQLPLYGRRILSYLSAGPIWQKTVDVIHGSDLSMQTGFSLQNKYNFFKLMESESLGSWRNPNFAFDTNLLLKIAKKQIRPAMPPRPYLCFFAKIMRPEPYLKFNRNWVTKLKPYLREEITLKLYGHPFH